MVTGLVVALFVLYDSFPWLTAPLRGCTNYWQSLTVVAVLLVWTLSSNHCLWASEKINTGLVAAEKWAAKKKNSSHAIWLKKYSTWWQASFSRLRIFKLPSKTWGATHVVPLNLWVPGKNSVLNYNCIFSTSLFFGDRWLLLSIYSQEFVDVIYHKKLCKISMN